MAMQLKRKPRRRVARVFKEKQPEERTEENGYLRQSQIDRLKARALRDRWGGSDAKLNEIAKDLFNRVGKAGARDAATITQALTGLFRYGLDEQKFELEKIKAADGPKTGTTVNVGVGVNVQQQFEERVAGRDYDELCAEIEAEAKAVLGRLEER